MADRIHSVQNTISPKPAKDASGARGGSSVRPGETASGETTAARSKESVTLTEHGQRIAELEKALSELPAIDQARVDAVKADIAAGKYAIDVENIADVLLATEAEFNDRD